MSTVPEGKCIILLKGGSEKELIDRDIFHFFVFLIDGTPTHCTYCIILSNNNDAYEDLKQHSIETLQNKCDNFKKPKILKGFCLHFFL